MERPSDPSATAQQASAAAARWVEAYLLAVVARERPGRVDALRCLQVEPADELEAAHLRCLGHHCDILLQQPDRVGERDWGCVPLVADLDRLPVPDHRFDVVWSGAFARLGRGRGGACARELARVCAPGGGVLLVQGNPRWPLARHRAELATVDEMRRWFVDEAGFADLRVLGLGGHRGWLRARGPWRLLAMLGERYLRWVSRPDRPQRQRSALNPTLAFWAAQAPLVAGP